MLSNIEKALFLKTIKLFESMTPEQLKILTNIAEEVQHQAGEILFRENDRADDLYVIVEGEVEIVKNYGKEGEFRLAVLHPNASFGELTLFGDEGRSATAIVSQDSTFLSIEKELLHLLIQENPAISTSIIFQLANMIRSLNRQLPTPASGGVASETDGRDAKTDTRRDRRVFIPGIVDIPELASVPAGLVNLSGGGLQISVPNQPDTGKEYSITLRGIGYDFQAKVATVVWSRLNEEDKSTWNVGMKWEMPEEEQRRLNEFLEKSKE